jgi:hypothetical protein
VSDEDKFIAWTQSSLRDAETALHNGDAAPRLAIWSSREPVSLFGAGRSATGQKQVRWKVAHRHADTAESAVLA